MPDGPAFYVALCESGGVHAKVTSDDTAGAFARARRESDAPIVACDAGLPELASLAQAKRLTLAPLSDPQRETRALLALLPGIAQRFSDSAAEKADLMRYMNACAELAFLESWTHPVARHMFEVTATGHGEATRHVLVLQQEGEPFGPGFGLLEPDIALQPASGNVLQIHGTGAFVVQLVDAPMFALPALREAFDIAHFPLAASLRRCHDHAPLLLAEVRLLTGVLECIPQLLNAQRASATVDGRVVTVKPHRDDALFGAPAGRA